MCTVVAMCVYSDERKLASPLVKGEITVPKRVFSGSSAEIGSTAAAI